MRFGKGERMRSEKEKENGTGRREVTTNLMITYKVLEEQKDV